MTDSIHTSKAPEALGPYSQAVRVGGFVFTSGQIPLTPAGAMNATDALSQANQCLDNIEAILNEAGLKLSDVVKTTIYLTDIKDFDAVNEAYAKRFTAPFPARSCVEVSALPKGVSVEIEAIAQA
ncbi:MAG: RidA family protein [Propionibacterium sp.]|nr:RidA family protein [Propionibacterium sp.]